MSRQKEPCPSQNQNKSETGHKKTAYMAVFGVPGAI